MSVRIGKVFAPAQGFSLFLDATMSDSYSGTGSTWRDLSSNTNNATLASNPLFTRLPSGAYSFSFDGSSQHASMNDIGLGGSFTLMTWLRKSSVTQTQYAVAAGWATYSVGPGAGYGVAFGVSNSSLILNSYGFSGAVVSGGSVPAGSWFHACVRHNASSFTSTLYLNGSAVGSGTFNNSSYFNGGAAATSYIGRGAYGDATYWNGSISQVIVYPSVISESQIVQSYEQTRGRYGI